MVTLTDKICIPRELLLELQTAIEDWTLSYAPEHCNPISVLGAQCRVIQAGGVLAY